MSDSGAELATRTLDEATVEVQRPVDPRTPGEQVSAILRGAAAPDAESPAPVEAPADESPPPAEAPAKLTVQALAERLGLDPEQVYALEVPGDDGEPVTLGALKDAWKDRARAEAEASKRREADDRQRADWQAERLRMAQELGDLLGSIPPEAVSPQVRDQAQRIRQYQATLEAERLLRAVPEWSDPARRAEDYGRIKGLAERYGITEADLGAVYDSRLWHLLRDATQWQQAVTVATQKPAAKPAARPAPAGSSPAQEFGRIRAAVTKGQMSRGDGVRAILQAAENRPRR